VVAVLVVVVTVLGSVSVPAVTTVTLVTCTVVTVVVINVLLKSSVVVLTTVLEVGGSTSVVVPAGKFDVALVEGLINFDDVFDGYSFEGVPDARVIIFKGFPVMAMMRLSTSASDGKANLHQGAVGVGLCLRTGRALRAVQFGNPLRHHPDTGLDLYDLKVPHWDTLLNLAASCYEMSGLGYIGTDMVLDKFRGPMLLELNARPGLAIQIANGRGLVPNLKTIEKLGQVKMNVEQRVNFAKDHFGIFDE
jgi:alpha-L-glutamate ligase-like protein